MASPGRLWCPTPQGVAASSQNLRTRDLAQTGSGLIVKKGTHVMDEASKIKESRQLVEGVAESAASYEPPVIEFVGNVRNMLAAGSIGQPDGSPVGLAQG